MSQNAKTQVHWPSLWLGTESALGIFGPMGEEVSIPPDTSGSLLRWHKAFEFGGYTDEDLARLLKTFAGDTREGLEVSIEYCKQAIDYIACIRGQIFFNLHERIDPQLTPVTWAELQYIKKNPRRLEHITHNPYFMTHLGQDSRIWRTPDLLDITTFIVDWYF